MSNYTQLQSDIADWFARSDLPATTFITLAQDEMNRTLRLQGMETMATATPVNQTTDGLYYITFPADMVELEHIEIDDQSLEYLSNNQMNTDMEGFYTIANEMILLQGISPVDIYYFARVPPLSVTVETNLFTDTAYDALLYLSLDHGSSYMKEPGDYRQRAVERLGEIAQMDARARMSGAPLVMRG